MKSTKIRLFRTLAALALILVFMPAVCQKTYAAATHTVRFYADENYEKVLYTVQVEDGAQVPNPAVGTMPVHPDHPLWTFDHWSHWNGATTSYGTHIYDMRFDFTDSVPTITEDMDFFATWGVRYRLGAYDLTTGKAFGECTAGTFFTRGDSGVGPWTGSSWTYGEYKASSMYLTATPAEGYKFAGWYVVPAGSTVEECTPVSKDLEYEYVPENGSNQNNSELNTLFAVFKVDQPTLTLHWSSMDGVDLMDPIEIDVPKGTTFRDALASKGWTQDTVLFEKDGYDQWAYLKLPKPITEYSSYRQTEADLIQNSYVINEDTDVYCAIGKALDVSEITVTRPVCGTETTTPQTATGWDLNSQTNPPQISCPNDVNYRPAASETWLAACWVKYDGETETGNHPFIGTLEGGKDYYIIFNIMTDFGYYFAYGRDPSTGWDDYTGTLNVKNATLVETWFDYDFLEGIIKVTADHDWDDGVVKQAATTESTGTKLFTCRHCNATKTESIPKLPYPPGEDPNQTGEGGSPIGKGASAAAAEKAITTATSDEGPAGSVFGLLQLKTTKQTKNSIKLAWTKVAGAKSYVLYANKCGKGKKYQKLATYTGKSATIKKVAGAKLKKGTYYKFLMVALDSRNTVITASKTVHVATSGGKVGNDKKVTTKAKKNKATVKAKKTFKLAAKTVAASKKLKVKKHRKVMYETSNAKIATVTAKGVIKGVKKGTCFVYAYAQDGVCA